MVDSPQGGPNVTRFRSVAAYGAPPCSRPWAWLGTRSRRRCVPALKNLRPVGLSVVQGKYAGSNTTEMSDAGVKQVGEGWVGKFQGGYPKLNSLRTVWAKGNLCIP